VLKFGCSDILGVFFLKLMHLEGRFFYWFLQVGDHYPGSLNEVSSVEKAPLPGKPFFKTRFFELIK
jgi:hypothetical protein